MKSSLRRTVLKAGGTLLLSVMAPNLAHANKIVAVRVWPAEDYTRVTLENDSDLKATHFIVTNPDRMVVDIEGLQLNDALRQLVAKIQSNDPYISQVRVGQNRPNVVRLVFDLKEKIRPQVFTLQPVAGYQHRLVFDLYPLNPPDPIAALINKGDWITQPKEDAPPSQIVGNQSTTPDKQRDAAIGALADNTPANADSGAFNKMEKPLAVKRIITIALDPGHGGEDPGATGAGGNHEKNVVLLIAKRLKSKIEQQPNMRVMLTRDADYFVPLNTRVQKARAVNADLFVSIHADAFVQPTARGSSVFALSEKGASSTAARWLANKENSSDMIGGINLQSHDRQLASVLLDLSTTAQINDSMKVGSAVLHAIGGLNQLHKGSVEQAGFAVLKAPDIPSILIETAFISNPEEESRLIDPAYQDKMADAIVTGIKKYFSQNPPLAKNRMT